MRSRSTLAIVTLLTTGWGAGYACQLPETGALSDATPPMDVAIDVSDDVALQDVIVDSNPSDVDSGPPVGAPPNALIPNLELWLRSDNVIADDAGNVSRWPDQSGIADLSRHPAAPGGFQPLLEVDAGFAQPALAFHGQQYLQSPTWADASVSSPLTLFIVGGQTSALDSHYFFDSNTPAKQCAVLASSGLKFFAGSFTASAGSTVGPHAIVIIVTTSGTTIRNNSNTAQVANTNPATASLTGVTIGSYAGLGAFSLEGHIAELALWSRALLPSEVTSLNLYAANRYGITISP